MKVTCYRAVLLLVSGFLFSLMFWHGVKPAWAGPLALKSKDTEVIYRIFCICKPHNGAKLLSSASGIQVSLPDKGMSKADLEEPNAKSWMEYSDAPWTDNENKLFSTLFLAGADSAAGAKEAKLKGFVIRNDGAGHQFLGVVTSLESEFYAPARILSIPIPLYSKITDQSGYVNLDKLDSTALSSFKWPFSSSSKVTITSDNTGNFVMKGKLEIILGGEIGAGSNIKATKPTEIRIGPSGPEPGLGTGEGTFEISELVYLKGQIYLNFGEGSEVTLEHLSQSIQLVDSNGSVHNETNGKFFFRKGGWAVDQSPKGAGK